MELKVAHTLSPAAMSGVTENSRMHLCPLQEVYHNQGVCYMYLDQRDKAKELLLKAIQFQKHELSYIMLGKCYIHERDNRKAIEIFRQAVEWVWLSTL